MIRIEITGDGANDVGKHLKDLAAMMAGSPPPLRRIDVSDLSISDALRKGSMSVNSARDILDKAEASARQLDDALDAIDANNQPEDDTPPSPAVRLRGKAGEGRKRRTNVEIAEDEALEAAALAAGIPLEMVDSDLAVGISREQCLANLENVRAFNEREAAEEEPNSVADEEQPEPDAPEDETPVEKDEPAADEPKPDAPPATREAVREAIVAAAAKLPQPERAAFVQSKLNPFGVTKLGEVPDEKLGDLMATLA